VLREQLSSTNSLSFGVKKWNLSDNYFYGIGCLIFASFSYVNGFGHITVQISQAYMGYNFDNQPYVKNHCEVLRNGF